MKRVVVMFFMLVLMRAAMHAQQDTSLLPFRLFGGVEAGLSMHSGAMTRIGNLPSCCAEFTSGSGLSYAIGAGVEVPVSIRIGNKDVLLGARISYQGLSASMVYNEKIGAVIDGSTVTEGISRHDLTVGYAVLGLTPYVSLPLPVDLPLRVRLGVVTGIPLGASFDQSETLVDPSFPGFTFENGARTRNVGSGDIPNTSGLYAALMIGVQVEYALSQTLAVIPSLSYQHALSNVSTTTNWAAGALRAGVDVQVRLTPPVPPPAPPVPPPVKIASLRSDLQIEAKRTAGVIEVVGSDNTVATTLYEAAPVVFFLKGSTQPTTDATSTLDTYQQRVIEGLRVYASENPTSRITVIGSAVSDEPPQLARQRVTWAVSQLGIDAMSRIEARTEVNGPYEYPELADEHRSVRFLVDDVPIVIQVVTRDTTRKPREVTIPVTHVLTCEAGPCSSRVSATYAGQRVKVSGSDPVYRVTLPATGSEITEPLRIDCEVVDSTGARTTSSVTADVRLIATNQQQPIVRLQPPHIREESVVLGYCDFDDDDFTTTNPEGIRLVRKAIAEGKRVTLIASCDELGDDEYNDALMDRRARNAIRLLNVRAADVTIVRQPSLDGTNATPMQRIANRSVRAVIK